ncbi:unnamed protein product, partial [Candidula unifasciata]
LDPTEVVAHPMDCTHYIQCEFMKPIIRPCSGGLVFNSTMKTCVKPSPDLQCSSVQPCNNINGGYFAHPTNCRFYIICDRGRTVVQACKINFLWDDVSKTCVVAGNGSKYINIVTLIFFQPQVISFSHETPESFFFSFCKNLSGGFPCFLNEAITKSVLMVFCFNSL